MATKARYAEKSVCSLGIALYDPCTKRAIPGLTNGYLCSDVVSASFTENFKGGDKESRENGCGQTCITTTKPRCFEDITGELEVCLWNPSLAELIDGNPVYVDANGKVVGGASSVECPPERRLWIQYTVQLVPADFDECEPGETLDLYRTYIIPNALVTMTGQTMSAKSGLADSRKLTIRDGKQSRPANGYTGPFGDVPADFFSSFGVDKRGYYYFDHAALPAGADCDELVAVA
jgi:hypothetical protein